MRILFVLEQLMVEITLPASLGLGETIVIEGAASEATLQKLLEMLKDSSVGKSATKRKEASASKAAAVAAGDALFAKKEETKATETSTKTKKEETSDTKTRSLETKKIHNAVIRNATNLGSSFIKLESPVTILKTVFDGLTSIGKSLGGFSGAFVTAGAVAAGFVSGQVVQLIEAFDKINDAGASFGGNLDDLARTAVHANLNVKKFGEAITKNKEAILQFGGSMTAGAKMVSKVAHELSGQKMLQLGFNYEEMVDVTADYLEILSRQTSFTRREQLTDREIARETEKYARSLKIVAELTGDDAKQQRAAKQAQNAVAGFRAAISAETPVVQDNLKSLAAQMAKIAPGMDQVIHEIVAFGRPVTQQANLLAMQNRGMVDLIRTQIDMARGTDIEGFQQSMVRIMPSMRDAAKLALEQNRDMAKLSLLGVNNIFVKTLESTYSQLTTYVERITNLIEKGGPEALIRNINEAFNNPKGTLADDVRRAQVSLKKFQVSVQTIIIEGAFPSFTVALGVLEGATRLLTGGIEMLTEAIKRIKSYLKQVPALSPNAIPGTGGVLEYSPYGGPSEIRPPKDSEFYKKSSLNIPGATKLANLSPTKLSDKLVKLLDNQIVVALASAPNTIADNRVASIRESKLKERREKLESEKERSDKPVTYEPVSFAAEEKQRIDLIKQEHDLALKTLTVLNKLVESQDKTNKKLETMIRNA